MDLSEAIDIAAKGDYPPEPSWLDGHQFYIRAVTNKNMLQGDETSYFRHTHHGKDDRVFYSIKLGRKKGEYAAKLTRIQFRGPFVRNGFRDIGDHGIDITDAWNVLKSTPWVGGVVGGVCEGFIRLGCSGLDRRQLVARSCESNGLDRKTDGERPLKPGQSQVSPGVSSWAAAALLCLLGSVCPSEARRAE